MPPTLAWREVRRIPIPRTRMNKGGGAQGRRLVTPGPVLSRAAKALLWEVLAVLGYRIARIGVEHRVDAKSAVERVLVVKVTSGQGIVVPPAKELV